MSEVLDTDRGTGERLRAVTIGEPAVLAAPIVLVEYDQGWPTLFAVESARIAVALGERALTVEHVGSTSVPGLVAKPIIDILLVVADSSDERSYVSAMEQAGYVLRIREPDWHQHRMFRGPEAAANVHVFSDGCVECDRMLSFRGHLRSNPSDRRLYQRSKRELAQRTWQYTQDYADAKSAVVEDILSRCGQLAIQPDVLRRHCVHATEGS